MRMKFMLIALAAGAVATAALAQQTDASPGKSKSSGSSEARASVSRSSYGADDCRKDMENAKEARQAGHITEREYAEQKKMALTKLKRDAGQTGAAGTGADCN